MYTNINPWLFASKNLTFKGTEVSNTERVVMASTIPQA